MMVMPTKRKHREQPTEAAQDHRRDRIRDLADYVIIRRMNPFGVMKQSPMCSKSPEQLSRLGCECEQDLDRGCDAVM